MPTMLSVLEEETENLENFPPYVDANSIEPLPDSPSKKGSIKTFEEIQLLLQNGKKREVKQIIRENAWPIEGGIRRKLWPALCLQHTQKNTNEEGYYWEMVKQLFGTTGKIIFSFSFFLVSILVLTLKKLHRNIEKCLSESSKYKRI